MADLFEKAVQIVHQAVQQDSVGNYREALNYYQSALEAFISGLKCT